MWNVCLGFDLFWFSFIFVGLFFICQRFLLVHWVFLVVWGFYFWGFFLFSFVLILYFFPWHSELIEFYLAYKPTVSKSACKETHITDCPSETKYFFFTESLRSLLGFFGEVIKKQAGHIPLLSTILPTYLL